MNQPRSIGQYNSLHGIASTAKNWSNIHSESSNSSTAAIVGFLQQSLHLLYSVLQGSQSPNSLVKEQSVIRKIALCNRYILLSGMNHIGLCYMFITHGVWWGLIEPVAVWLVGITIWVLNYRGHFFAGKTIFHCLAYAGTVYPALVFGHWVSGIEYILVSALLALFFFYEHALRDKILLAVFVPLNIVSIYILQMKLPMLDYSSLVQFPEQIIAFIGLCVPYSIIYFLVMGVFLMQRDIQNAEKKLVQEKERSEALLLNILPHSIAEQLKNGKRHIAERFPEATVLVIDLTEFTTLTRDFPPTVLVESLDIIFRHFDSIIQTYNLEKIKTIGDCYVVAGGVPHHTPHHVSNVACAALELQNVVAQLAQTRFPGLQARIGIHTGELVAGVIGDIKFTYDIWGEAMKVAGLLKTLAKGGSIHCSQDFYVCLTDKFVFEAADEFVFEADPRHPRKGRLFTWNLLGKTLPDIPTDTTNTATSKEEVYR